MIIASSLKSRHSPAFLLMNNSCIGRFAPSPTGPLHFGSLVAALGSYLDARQQQGLWKLRIDDIDETRTVDGAADHIMCTLEQMGFQWDQTPIYQSSQIDLYQDALATLTNQQLAYLCSCTRSGIAAIAQTGPEGHIYPGTCRNGPIEPQMAKTLRLRTSSETISFVDRILGPQQQNIEKDIGDFVIRRSDGFMAYQLAVVVDDQIQGINQVVRGADLLGSTPRQIYLQQLLKLQTPEYAHLPLVKDSQGKKLSKRDQAHPIDTQQPLIALTAAWRFLQPRSACPEFDSIDNFWSWAILNWNINNTWLLSE